MPDNTMIRIQVIGLPASQGNKSAVFNGGKAHVIEGNSKTMRAKHKSWRSAVTEAARDHAEVRGEPIREPVTVTIVFRLPPTKSDPHRHRHATTPDLDKCVRSTLDALVHARLLHDDSFVWHLDVWKVYATGSDPIGATIHVELNGAQEAAHIAEAKARALDRKARERAEARAAKKRAVA